MYFDKMVHEWVFLRERCPLTRGVVKVGGHCSSQVQLHHVIFP